MELTMIAYWMDVIPGIGKFASVVASSSALIGLFGLIILVVFYEIKEKHLPAIKKGFKVFASIYIPILLIALLTPSKDGMKMIVGAYLTQAGYEQLVEVDGVKQLPEKAVKYISNFLDNAGVDQEQAEENSDEQ